MTTQNSTDFLVGEGHNLKSFEDTYAYPSEKNIKPVLKTWDDITDLERKTFMSWLGEFIEYTILNPHDGLKVKFKDKDDILIPGSVEHAVYIDGKRNEYIIEKGL